MYKYSPRMDVNCTNRRDRIAELPTECTVAEISAKVVTFEQFLFAHRSNIGTTKKDPTTPMPSTVQAGTILMKEWPGLPQILGLETEPSFGDWSLVKVMNGFALDRQIHAAGWTFFFMAAEVKAMFFGSLGVAKVQSALKRILAKVKPQHFNGLEVTAIVSRHFLGVPYVTVFAHSRHLQHSCNLDSAEARQASQDNAEWAKG